MTQFIVINECFGGFSLSRAAEETLRARGVTFELDEDLPRDNPELVAVVRELGTEADGACAALAIAEVPDGVEWRVEEYDGTEWVAEQHRTWTSQGEDARHDA